MPDEAACIDNSGMGLLFDEANSSFCIASVEGHSRVEYPAVCFNDFLMAPYCKAHLHILSYWSAKDDARASKLGKGI